MYVDQFEHTQYSFRLYVHTPNTFGFQCCESFVIQDVRMAEVEQLLVASGLQPAVINNLLGQIKMQPLSAPPASSVNPPLPADDVSPTLPLDSQTAALMPEPSAPSTPVRPIVCKLEDEPSLPKHADVVRRLEQQVLATRQLLADPPASGIMCAETASPAKLRLADTPSADLGPGHVAAIDVPSLPACQQSDAVCASLLSGNFQETLPAHDCAAQSVAQGYAEPESVCVKALPTSLMTNPQSKNDAAQHLQTQPCLTDNVSDAQCEVLEVKDASTVHTADAVVALQNQFRDELAALKAKLQAEADEATAAIMADLQVQKLKLAKEADDQVSAARAAAAQSERDRLHAEQTKAAMILEMQNQTMQLAKEADDKVSAARAAAAQAESDRLHAEQSKSAMISQLQTEQLKLAKEADALVCAAKAAAAQAEHDRVQALNALAAKQDQDQRIAAMHAATEAKALEAASIDAKAVADKQEADKQAAELHAEESRKSDDECAKAAELHCANKAVLEAAIADAVAKATAVARAELQELKSALQADAASKIEAAHAASVESKQQCAVAEQDVAKSSPADQSLTGAVAVPAGSTNDLQPPAAILAASHAALVGGRPRHADAVFTASTHHTEYVAYSRQCQAKCRSDSLMAKQFRGTAEQRAEGFQMFMKAWGTVLCSELC